jgi:PleD family two-component response regulator
MLTGYGLNLRKCNWDYTLKIERNWWILRRFESELRVRVKMFDILVVDDEEGILEATKDYLDLTGTFRIDTATSAREG